jgi:cytochrome P450
MELLDTALAPRILTSKGWPAGPSAARRIFSGQMFRYTGAEFLRHNAQHYGDLVHFTAGGRHVFQLNHPTMVQELLARDVAHHHRGIVMQRARFVLGDGLLTSEEPLHLRQRRLTQPGFHRDRIAGYGDVIGRYALEMARGWHSGVTRDVHHDMLLLALRIVGKCLFNADVESEVRNVSAAVDAFMGFLPLALLPFPGTVLKLPLPLMRRIRRGQAELDTLIYSLIRQRRESGVDQGDLLSMLLAAVDTEEQTGSMSDRQVRDECLTLLLAGHETTANALSFALWLLALHPEWQEGLHREAAAALQAESATAADYPQLPLAWQHFAETMRLYPPVWVTARTAATAYTYRDVSIPQGSILLAPQIVLHHDPRWWPEPERYDPARFTPTRSGHTASREEQARPRMAWFPFGAGTRQCIGEGFAWMEGVLTLATIVREWRVTLPPGHSGKLETAARITLRPKAGMVLRLERRR